MDMEFKKSAKLVLIVIVTMLILGYGMTCLFKYLLKNEVMSTTEALY